VIGIATRRQAGLSGIRIPSDVRNLSFLHKVLKDSGVHTSSHTMVNEVLLGVKAAGT
jgi:hypothetical protein